MSETETPRNVNEIKLTSGLGLLTLTVLQYVSGLGGKASCGPAPTTFHVRAININLCCRDFMYVFITMDDTYLGLIKPLEY